jgi:hypothetical protein
MVADLADSRDRERNFCGGRCDGHGAALIYYRPESKRSMTTYLQLQTLASGPVGMHHPPFTAVPEKGRSAPRPSLGAWTPKPITVNHRPRQFFARACNREGVINPANSVERSLRGTQDVAMLGGVVALERVDDNVCHWRAPGSGDLGNKQQPAEPGHPGLTGMFQRSLHYHCTRCSGIAPLRNWHDVGGSAT